MINIALADDEIDSIKTLRRYISHFMPQHNIIWEAGSVKSTLELLYKEQPDLLFLDVMFQDGTGFDILEQFAGNAKFQTIFITGHDEFAIKAFQYSAINYLLKPIDAELFSAAIKQSTVKVLQQNALQNMTNLLEIHKTSNFDKLVLHSEDGFRVLSKKNIIRIEAQGHSSQFILDSGEKIYSRRPLTEFEHLLIEDGFFRTHKSHLINIAFVKYYSHKDGDAVEMQNGDLVSISRRRRTEFFELFYKF